MPRQGGVTLRPMARQHTMFIPAQNIPWDRGVEGFRKDTEAKLLSLDDGSGACTTIIRYPAGWRRSGPFHLSAHEELLVLEGALEINERRYGFNDYGNLPAGYTRSSMSAPDGAVVLTMFAQAPEEKPGAGEHDPKLLVEHIDVAGPGLEGWTENPYTRYLVGTGVRPLREDPYTGEISILYSALPYRFMAKRWTHPEVQEMFVLAGEYAINDVGVMSPGSYAWWREQEVHGPYGSRTGFMMFIRSDGGPLSNIIEEEIIDVDYHAPYRPVLPERLKPYADTAPVRQTVY